MEVPRMGWQTSVARALRDLKAEESRLAGELGQLRQRIASLGGVASSGGGAKTKGKRRQLSPAARAAISRAAKKRWAKYRADKSKA
jgi:hypothetical protein